MTSKPDSVSTLGYHRTDHTGAPLEPQVHWDTTGTTLADATTQWCPSGDPVFICIIGTHRKTIRATSTLGCHWNQTGWSNTQWCLRGDPVLICIIGSHWKVTGRPLETHWLPTIIAPVAFQCTLVSELRAHWIATGLPLDYHWLRVRDSLPTHYAVPDLDDQNCGVMQMGLFPMNGRFLSDKAHLWTCMGIKTKGVFIVDVGINSFFSLNWNKWHASLRVQTP